MSSGSGLFKLWKIFFVRHGVVLFCVREVFAAAATFRAYDEKHFDDWQSSERSVIALMKTDFYGY